MGLRAALPIISVAALLSFAALSEGPPSQAASADFPRIVRLDPRFDAIVPPAASIEKLTEDFSWVEGPVWNARTGSLLFSDIPANAVREGREGRGTTLFLSPAGYTGESPFTGREPGSNGLAFDAEGRLVLCEHGDRRIARLEPDGNGKKTVLADRYELDFRGFSALS